MSVTNNNIKHIVLLVIILILSLFVRTFGLNWDNGYHLHPDERFLTMVLTDIKMPLSIKEYFDTATSPLNPYNNPSYHFFVYGTFPIFLVKSIATFLHHDTYDSVHFVGRIISAIFDSINIICLFFISKQLFSGLPNIKKHPQLLHLAGFVYCFTVLPIQLSHFLAVDTFLTSFIVMTFLWLSLWLRHQNFIYFLLAALTYGLATACKVSVILFSPVIILFWLFYFIRYSRKYLTVLYSILFVLLVLITFRVFQPYAFTGLVGINPDFVSSLKELNGIINNRDPYYPPEIQYLSKTPILYPLNTIIVWGLGLPVSIILIIALFKLLRFIILKPALPNIKTVTLPVFLLLLTIFWIIFLIVEQGLQFTNTVRYFLPVYPFMVLLFSYIFASGFLSSRFLLAILLFHLVYCFSFMTIYLRPHSRLQASVWIYNNIPLGSTITNEIWDDPLPLGTPDHQIDGFNNIMLPLYDPDTPQKMSTLASTMAQTDYVIMSSNRLWGSISQVPSRYPDSSRFYQDLFDETSGFKLIKAFNSYPGIMLPFLNKCYYVGLSIYPYRLKNNNWFDVDPECSYPGIYLRDDTAEEAFTVYDHPQVLIFQNVTK